jgi:hypothetical protein
MQSGDHLFPAHLTRRDFLQSSAALTAGAALTSGVTFAEEAKAEKKPVTFGSGKVSFTLDDSFGKLPAGMKYGLGCAVVVDSKDRIFVTSRSASPCVAIFDKDGKLLETWSKEFAEGVGFKPEQVVATAHGLFWSKEGSDEYLYWTENVAGKSPKIGARVYKTDLKGKVLYTLGNVEKESSTSQKFDFTNPTDVAIAKNGDIYVVDGYGSQLVHRFDKNFKLVKTIGGRGKEHGKFNTCHGVWVSTLGKEEEVWIADRANNRIEIFSTDLKYLRTIEGLRLPCCFYQHDGLMYVPELGARVTVLDPEGKVVAHLGDGAGDKEAVKNPAKFALPHALTLSSKGDLYIVEWVADGRVRKLTRNKA